MTTIRRNQEGIAMMMVLLAIIILAGAITMVVSQVYGAKRATDAAVRNMVLDEACKAGIDIGIQQIWNQYVVGNGNTTGNLASYRVFIDNFLPNTEDRDGNGTLDSGSRVLITESAPRQLAGGAVVTNLRIDRTDDMTGSNMTLTVTAQYNGETRRASQTVRVSGAPFTGFGFAVLANNINCILCHAEFRALDLERSLGDPSTYGTFDRIKVATLESLLIRTTEADSRFAGTVYTRGVITNPAGTPLTAAQLAGCSGHFGMFAFNNTNGKLTQNPTTGALVGPQAAVAGQPGPDGKLQQFANFYMNYPDDPALMTDGDVPTNFPAPFGDDNENRYVDDDEFARVMNTVSGSITGGVAYGVPEGQFYTGNSLPAAPNTALNDLTTTGTYNGNLILVGTDENPIRIDGNVAINGDLVIKGKVKGWGQLFVRGNTYVVGDVTYADAPGEFGRAADGTENGLALVSGGSILIGDYLTIRGKNHTQDTSKYPNTSYSIRCREANKTANVTLNKVTQTLRYGYFDPGVIDAGRIEPTMLDANGNPVTRTGQQFSFTTSELMLFNNKEVGKMMADPNYIPRFYGLRDSQPDALYCYHHPPDEHSVRYDESGGGVQNLVDYMVARGVSPDRLNNAAFHYMNPRGNWISEDTLRQIWWQDEQSRPSSGRRFQVDGLLYSNNAIFCIVRSRARHGSYTDGKMTVRGAIICPDLGVLTAGDGTYGNKSFLLYYDRRVQRFWSLEDTQQVAFRRLVYANLPQQDGTT